MVVPAGTARVYCSHAGMAELRRDLTLLRWEQDQRRLARTAYGIESGRTSQTPLWSPRADFQSRPQALPLRIMGESIGNCQAYQLAIQGFAQQSRAGVGQILKFS